jgi:hypothetical protein
MASNFAAIKAKARRDVHASLSVSARYESYSQEVIVDGLSVRWHNKQQLVGDRDSGGYAQIIDGIERIVFMQDELQAKGVTLEGGDVIIIKAEGYGNVGLVLQTQEPIVGPVEVIWQVSRKN